MPQRIFAFRSSGTGNSSFLKMIAPSGASLFLASVPNTMIKHERKAFGITHICKQ